MPNIAPRYMHPEDFNLSRCDARTLRVSTVDESVAMLRAALMGKHAAARDIVALNAGASLYVAGLSASMGEGVARALEVIASGAASAKIEQVAQFTNQFR